MRISIQTPSRLHFGLLAWNDALPRRHGGAGLMIEAPGLELQAAASEKWSVTGDVSPELVERARLVLGELAEKHPERPIAVELMCDAPEHSGLGTGTQLSLALARAVHTLNGRSITSVELAKETGRGRRSAVGVHGFDHGGLIVDGGKGAETAIGPMVARFDFPLDWPILLIQPELPAGLHGDLEKQAFVARDAIPVATTERLSRLLVLGMLPAVAERDYWAFGESLYEYNRRVGECFAFAQGGPYGHALLEEIVDALRYADVPAVGQSSWGPTLFAIVSDAERVEWVVEELRERFPLSPMKLTITTANNTGARIAEQ